MNVDTRNGWLAIIAMSAMAFVVAVSAVGIVALAWHEDGALSNQAMQTFTQTLLGAGFGGVLLGIVERVMSGYIASKAISQGASVQGSPVSVTSSSSGAPIALFPSFPAAADIPASLSPDGEPQAG